MIFVQLSQVKNSEVEEILSGVRERVLAMGQIHMLFYKEEGYFKMGLGSYLEKLVAGRIEALSNKYTEADIDIHVNITDRLEKRISFDEAKQLGVIINEIITNVFKHAFFDNDSPFLSFHAEINQNNHLIIQIKDNGNSIKKNTIANNNTFGLNMVRTICQQLEWEITRLNNKEGTTFTITIPVK